MMTPGEAKKLAWDVAWPVVLVLLDVLAGAAGHATCLAP